MTMLNSASTPAASGELAWGPDDAWKRALKDRLDAEATAKIEKATREYFLRLEPDLAMFNQHNESIKKIRKDAEESYNAEVERERQEHKRWAIPNGQWDLLATFSAKPDPIVLPPVSPNVLIPIDGSEADTGTGISVDSSGFSPINPNALLLFDESEADTSMEIIVKSSGFSPIDPNVFLPFDESEADTGAGIIVDSSPVFPRTLFSGASAPALEVLTRDATGGTISPVLGTLRDDSFEENSGANPIPASPSVYLTRPSLSSDAQHVSGAMPVLSPSSPGTATERLVYDEPLSRHERSLDRREEILGSLEREVSRELSAIQWKMDRLRERGEKQDLPSGAEHEAEHPAHEADMNPPHRPLSIYEQGSASRTTEEHLPIVDARTSPPPAQASVPQVEFPAPEPQIIPQVAELSDGDASDRSGTSSIYMPSYDLSADPIAPGLIPSHTDEPQLSSTEYEGPYKPVGEVQRDTIMLPPTPKGVWMSTGIGDAYEPVGEVQRDEGDISTIMLPPTPERKVMVLTGMGDTSDRSRTPSVHTPDDDPFTNLTLHSDEPDLKNGPYEPVGGIPGHGDIIMPAPVNVGHPKSIQEAASARSIATDGMASYGFDTGESPPPLPRSGSHESILYLQPPAYHDHVTISPPVSEGIPMDCGVIPSSFVYPPGQGPSRRRMASSSEQGRANNGDNRARVGWAAPFAFDHRSNNSHQQDSGEPPDGVYNVTHKFEAHEVSPNPLPASPSSSGYDPHLQSPANPQRTIAPAKPPRLQNDRPSRAHGWVECILPDENLYYVHQVYQVVTDVDLSDEKILDAVMAYLEDHGDVIPPGQELWLRNTGSCEGGFVPLRCLIDHSKQLVALDSLHEANGDSVHHCARRGDDRLDAKYRYWSFMEAHPAHTSLPLDACQEAMDALNWASTNELLPSHLSTHLSTPTPFTREECQALTFLLQSIDRRGETPLRTHTVSKILLRVVCWRQSHFRSDKPLPVDASRGSLHLEDHTMPSALMRTAGLCACLAAAIALGPSKSFVRIAGLSGLLFSLPLVVSNVMTITQSKANNESMVPHAKRDTHLPSRKGDTTTDSQPPPWHMRLWQGLEFPLYIATSGPSNVILTTSI